MATLPLDLVRLILLKATPRTLWSSRLVCKRWYSLLISPDFVAARRSATGGAWLVTLHQTFFGSWHTARPVSAAWILMYNPLLNIQEEVRFPIDQTWPGAHSTFKREHLLYVYICGAEGKNLLTLAYHFATLRSDVRRIAWNPVSGLTQESVMRPRIKGHLPPPQDVAGRGWTRKYAGRFQDGLLYEWSEDVSALMAYSGSGLKIYRECIDRWEFVGAMPDDMWQLMGESKCLFVATSGYYLIWTQHAYKEPEMAALFQPAKGRWTWVDNIWHSCSGMCRWKKEIVFVFPCF